MAGELHKLADNVPNLYFTGWLDIDDIDYVLKRSHVGVCSTGATSEREFFPNKVFLLSLPTVYQ